MAAKRKRSRVAKKKKKVAVHLDADTVRNLAKAVELMAGMAQVLEAAADDAALRRELLKKKKGARSRRKK